MNGHRPWSGEAVELVGSTLAGRYAIDAVLGEGAMGVVYAGRHLSLGRAVAIKVLRPELGRRPEFRERFLREAQAASRIGHPNVVDILDFGHDGPFAFSVMELLVGEDLGQRLARCGRLGWTEAAPILLGVARALAAAHASRIVHRDVKPANVMLVGRDGGTNDVKVLDFGIAKLGGGGHDGLTHHGAIMGTVAYMAPEQARGGPIDHRVDVYAFGVLMYRTLTGVLPGPTDLIERLARPPHVAPPRSLVPEMPVWLEAAILRAMADSPVDRFQTMAELEAALAGAPRIEVEPTWAMNGEPALVRTPTYVLPELHATAAPAPTQWLPPGQTSPPPRPPPSIATGHGTGFTFATAPRRGFVAAIVAGVAVLALVSGTLAGLWLAGDDDASNETLQVAQAHVVEEPKPAVVEPSEPSGLVVGDTPAQPVDPAKQPDPVEPTQRPDPVEPAEPVITEQAAAPEPKANAPKKNPKKKAEKIDPMLASIQIVVASSLPPAAVRVDGRKRGRTPVVARVSPGAHVVDFAWPDGRSFSQRVELSKGQKLLVKGYAR